jgi:hypothetical protein
VALLALLRIDVQVAQEALQGEAVGAIGAGEEVLQAEDLLVGVVVFVGAALLEGLERRDGFADAVLSWAGLNGGALRAFRGCRGRSPSRARPCAGPRSSGPA